MAVLRARLPPSISSSWLPVSATEWMASASIEAELRDDEADELRDRDPEVGEERGQDRLATALVHGRQIGTTAVCQHASHAWTARGSRRAGHGGRPGDRGRHLLAARRRRSRRSPSTTGATPRPRTRQWRRSKPRADGPARTPPRSRTTRPRRRWWPTRSNDFGYVDILVNNAGIASRGNVGGRHRRRRARAARSGARARVRTSSARHVLPSMRTRHRGDIVMVSSVATSPLRRQRSAVQHGQGRARGAGVRPRQRGALTTAST